MNTYFDLALVALDAPTGAACHLCPRRARVALFRKDGGAANYCVAHAEEEVGRWLGGLPDDPDRRYDPAYGDDVPCVCGHPYHRHFDTFDEMEPVGCKYCDTARCPSFRPQTPPGVTHA